MKTQHWLPLTAGSTDTALASFRRLADHPRALYSAQTAENAPTGPGTRPAYGYTQAVWPGFMPLALAGVMEHMACFLQSGRRQSALQAKILLRALMASTGIDATLLDRCQQLHDVLEDGAASAQPFPPTPAAVKRHKFLACMPNAATAPLLADKWP